MHSATDKLGAQRPGLPQGPRGANGARGLGQQRWSSGSTGLAAYGADSGGGGGRMRDGGCAVGGDRAPGERGHQDSWRIGIISFLVYTHSVWASWLCFYRFF